MKMLLRPIILGIILGSIFNFLAVYLSLKTGIVALGSTALLGYVLLKLTGEYLPRWNGIVVITSGAIVASMMGITTAVAAITIFTPQAINISFFMIFSLSLIGSVLGVFFLLPFKKRFVESPQFQWPTVTPTVKVVQGLDDRTTNAKGLAGGFGVSAVYATFSNSMKAIPSFISINYLPPYIGISTSALIASIGFFIGYKNTFLMLIGALYSAMVWFIFEGDASISFSNHLLAPQIFSVAISLIMTSAIIEIIQTRKSFILPFKKNRINIDGFSKYTLLSLILFIVSANIFLSKWSSTEDRSILIILLLIGLPVAFISGISVVRAMAETGFSEGFSLHLLLLIGILLFRIDFVTVILLVTLIQALEDFGANQLKTLKIGDLLGVGGNDVIKLTVFGLIYGSLIGSGTIYILYKTYGFGNEFFPAPYGVWLGAYAHGILSMGKVGGLPVNYNLGFLLLGSLLAIFLYRLRYSPISLAMGMLIPPAYTAAMCIGALFDYHLTKKHESDYNNPNKKEKWMMVFAGVMAGEGIITALYVMMQI